MISAWKVIRAAALWNAAASTLSLPSSKPVRVFLRVCSLIYFVRLVVAKRLRTVVALLLSTARFPIAKGGEVRTAAGHALHDLLQIYPRYKLNLPPSMLLRRKPFKYGPFQRHKADLQASKELGPIASANRFALMGTRTFIFVSDPDTVKKVMTDKVTFPSRGPTGFSDLTPFGLLGLPSGEMHTKHRRLIGKFMSARYLESFSKIIADETDVLLKKWSSCAKKEEPTNVCYDLSMITLQIIMRTAIGTTGEEGNLQHMDEKDNEDYHYLDYALKEIMISTAFPLLGLFPTPKLRAGLKKSDELWAKIKEEADGSLNDNGAATMYSSLMNLGKEGKEEDKLSEDEILQEMMTIRGAGHETTSHTLSWALLLLYQNPECMKKLREEAARELSGDIATFEETKRLTYTHMVVYETLRMYPTVPSFPREAACDTQLLGYDVPKKSLVFVCQNAMNRSEKLWTNPDQFDPERFRKLPELLMSKPIGIPDGHNFGFIPFGAGNRTCVGQRLAMLEAVQMLSSIAKNFTWVLSHPEKRISEVADITLGPKEGLDITFTKSYADSITVQTS